MPDGLAINRRWVLVLVNGAVIIDWGNSAFQDVHSGEIFEELSLIGSHTIQEEELVWMKRTGEIVDYDEANVYVSNLPELPKKTIE